MVAFRRYGPGCQVRKRGLCWGDLYEAVDGSGIVILIHSDRETHLRIPEEIEIDLKEEGDATETDPPMLTPHERDVLKMRFGLEDGYLKTFEEVGRHFNVTRERIRQIEAKVLKKLRQYES